MLHVHNLICLINGRNYSTRTPKVGLLKKRLKMKTQRIALSLNYLGPIRWELIFKNVRAI